MTPPRAHRGRPRLPATLAIVVVAVAALGAIGVAYMFSGAAPSAVSLAAPATATAAPAPASTAAPPTVPPGAPGSGAPGSGAPSGAPAASAPGTTGGAPLDGTWTVSTSIGSFSDFSDSFVGYRVNENLAQVGSTTAVGRTPDVSGSLTFSGSSVTAAAITADLTTLRSDKSMRDGQLRSQALQTDQFPTATFELTSPIALAGVQAAGQTLSATAQGKLTLHGVTRDVSIPLQAKLSGGVVTVIGSLTVQFADYAISPPRSMVVLSVDDFGVMEFQLHFTRG